MKRLKLMLAMLSVSLLCACVGLFAACGGLTDPEEETTYYTVTIAPYDGEGGTVAVSAPASDKGYVKDEQVTVTVTPAENYEADEVKVNGADVTLTEGKYTFKVAGNTVVSATFKYIGWRNIAWHNDTLGTLTFDADYNMTLTPEGGEAQAVTIVTAGVDLSEGFPEGEIGVTVGAQAYKVSFGTFLEFKQDYTTYIFDSSDSITDFTAYVGTWKQYNSTNELVATATDLTYGNKTYTEYYTAFDGSHYVKDGTRRYLFGYLDNAKKVVYFDYRNGNVFYFTADGTLPHVAFPAEFYGEWWNARFFTFAISATGATIDDTREVDAFAVSGAGEDAVVHVYYDKGLWTVYLQKNAETSETEIVMDDGTQKVVFTAVKPELLPTEYRGTWTELVGEKTLTIDTTGKLTYEGKPRETTRDSHDFGFHFLTEAGNKATVMYFPKGGVLALDDGDGNISYYAKKPLNELKDVPATEMPAGTWTSGDKTLTVSAEHKITLTEGAEAAKPVRLVSWELIDEDNPPHYSAEAIYNGVYYLFDYELGAENVTFAHYNDFARRTDDSLTFTKNTQGGDTDPTVTIPSDYADVKGTWTEVVMGGSPRTLVITDEGNIKVSGTDVTATAVFSGDDFVEFKLTVGGTQYTVMFAPEVGTSVEHGALVFVSDSGDYIYFRNTAVTSKEIGEADLYSTRWTMESSNINISADGALDYEGDPAFILSYAEDSGTPQWTMFLNGMFLKAVVSGNKLSLYDLENFGGGTAMMEFDRQTVGVTFPADLRGEWVCTTFAAPEYTGGSSAIDKEVSLVIATDTAKWGTEDIKTVTDAGEGKYSFTTTSPVDGDDATTYTFWLQDDDILLLDDGTQTYALFKKDWDALEEVVKNKTQAPEEFGTGDWTGANGEKLKITAKDDNTDGHEVFITVKDKKLDDNPLWLFEGATTTLAKGYVKPEGPSHYVYAEMSLSQETITVKLFFRFSQPDVYTFTKGGGTLEETYETPIGMRDTWTLFTNGALDNSHTIEVTKNSIKFDGAAVTGVSVDDDVVTFTANDKTYTAQTVADDYALRLKAEGDGTYSIYVSSLLDESEKAYTTFTGTWTCEQGVGDLVFAADGSATLNGKAVFGVAGGHIGVTYFTFVADGMVYKATLSGSTITLTDLDNHTYTYTK